MAVTPLEHQRIKKLVIDKNPTRSFIEDFNRILGSDPKTIEQYNEARKKALTPRDTHR